MSDMEFTVLATDGRARLGRLDTAHGPLDTPAFMPVGTAATVKAMTPAAVASTGAQCVLGGAAATDFGGWFVQPTIFTGVDNQMRIAREEVFGWAACTSSCSGRGRS